MATDIITQAIQKAVDLREEKHGLYKTVSANRSFLRNADESGLLTDEQAAWLADFYPLKAAKGTGADEAA